jgi:hypothetical protein
MAELLLGQPLFPSETGVDHLVEIIKVLGTPSRSEMCAMNESYSEFKFPVIPAHPRGDVFRTCATTEAMDLVYSMLQFDPRKRISPWLALGHRFFDDLRNPRARLTDGHPLPPLFNWTAEEIAADPLYLKRITPAGAVSDALSAACAAASLRDLTHTAAKPPHSGGDLPLPDLAAGGASADSSSPAPAPAPPPPATAAGPPAAADATGGGGAPPAAAPDDGGRNLRQQQLRAGGAALEERVGPSAVATATAPEAPAHSDVSSLSATPGLTAAAATAGVGSVGSSHSA